MKIQHVVVAILILAPNARLPDAAGQTLTTLWWFCSVTGESGGCADGIGPEGGLVQGNDGYFYGTTYSGGTNDLAEGGGGTVYRIGSVGALTTVHMFAGPPAEGKWPAAGLLQARDGYFYGTTYYGGTYNNGTVFQMTSEGSLTTLYSFTGGSDGGLPHGALVQATNGDFYGTDENLGDTDDGTVFQITSEGTLTTLYQLGSLPTDGILPDVGLVLGSDGFLYGTTYSGGTNDDGTVFKITTQGTLTTLYQFGGTATNGNGPAFAALVQAADTNFYGTTDYGGTNNGGTVFQITSEGTLATLYQFGGLATDGLSPEGGLIQASDGNFYGTTSQGGTNNQGTIFKITPQGSLTTLYQFGNSDGADPIAGLLEGSDGYLYGTTASGGPLHDGSVFKIDVGLGPLCTNSISPTNAVFAAGGGSNTVSVTASNGCAWSATSNAGFITITAGSVGEGDGTVSYFVAPNPNAIAQTGSMTIAGQTYTINEAAAPCNFLLLSSSATFTAAGGSDSVTVTANGTSCIWTAISNNAFILVDSGSIVSGDGTVSYSVAANTNASEQMGTITIAGQTYTVFEEGAPSCTYALTSAGANFGAAGGSCNVGVTAANGCAWTASITNSWITVTAGSSGSGTGTLSYSVAANTSAASRSGTMTIGGQTFTVNQLGANPVTYSFSTPVQTLKTKLNKKTGVTTTNCTVAVKLVVANTGTTATAKSTVLLWLDQGCTFNPSVGLAPLTEKVSALKEGKSHTIKVKTKKLTEDLAGTFIFATDAGHNILASVEVPSSE
jgi:uncharacterized repeat protein (TIGR03803 family)